MTKDEALRMALDALFTYEDDWPEDGLGGVHHNVIYDEKKIFNAITAIKEALAQPEQEPPVVAELLCVCGAEWEWRNRDWELVSTPPQRKPLTDEQIGDIWYEQDREFGYAIRFARAIEAAHGIKE